jgi:hypothetical protein
MSWKAATIAVGLAFCVVFDMAYCHRPAPAVTRHKRSAVVAPVRYQEGARAMYAWSFVCPQ